jgi:hypothetical protein
MKPATNYSPNYLLGAARKLVLHPDAGSKGVWPRAAAHLCRQALEMCMEDFWKKHMPGLENMPLRVQLICLPTYMKDKELAHSIAYTWGALSNACHHHVYELAPTSAELESWINTVNALCLTATPTTFNPNGGPVLEECDG